MVMSFGGIYFDDVDGEVWTDRDRLRPYSDFKDIWDIDDYYDYRDEYMREHGYYDEEEEEEDDNKDDEEGDSDAEDIG